MSNSILLQGFEWYLPDDGNHWNHLGEIADELKNTGIDMIWLPPAYKGASGAVSVGYDVYDKYDLGEFYQKGTIATKYGTKEEYLECIRRLQQKKLKVICDIVVNHMMGADAAENVIAAEYSGEDRTEQIAENQRIKAWTRFTFPGRNGAYSEDTWDRRDFNATDHDDRTDTNGIYRFKGKVWSEKVDWEKGNFDYLMGANVDMKRPATAKKVLDWGRWYMETTGADGVRLDAVKHISNDFVPKLLEEMRKQTGADMFAVGEYWSGELERLLSYLDEVGETCTLFDVPFHYAMCNASRNGGFDMRYLMTDSLLKARPECAVTFVDNHDTQPGQALESFVEPWFKQQAYSMILFQQNGLPCVFYGDLYGIPHNDIAPVAKLPELCRARKHCAFGSQRDYITDPHVIGFTRAGDEENAYSGMAVLVTNGAGGTRSMYVNATLRGEHFVNLLKPEAEPVVLDEHGMGNFYVDDGAAAVWIRRNALEKFFPELAAELREKKAQEEERKRKAEEQEALLRKMQEESRNAPEEELAEVIADVLEEEQQGAQESENPACNGEDSVLY